MSLRVMRPSAKCSTSWWCSVAPLGTRDRCDPHLGHLLGRAGGPGEDQPAGVALQQSGLDRHGAPVAVDEGEGEREVGVGVARLVAELTLEDRFAVGGEEVNHRAAHDLTVAEAEQPAERWVRVQ